MKTNSQIPQIPDTILGVKLSDKNLKHLKEGKETTLVEGFVHRNGEKFDAYLNLNDSGKLVFRLPETPKFKSNDERELFKRNISLAKLAYDLGFTALIDQHLIDSGIYDYLLMVNENHQRIIIHKDLNDNEFKFFGLDQPGLEGNIFDFLSFFTFMLPEDQKKFLQKHLNTAQDAAFNFIGASHDLETAFRSVYHLNLPTSESLMNDRDIQEETFDHSFFRGKILDYAFTPKSKSENFHCVFPTYRSGNIFDMVNLQGKSTFQAQFNHSVSPKGIWYSNIIHRDKIRRLFLVSSPLEAFYHFQVFGKPSDFYSLYASIMGKANPDQIKEIQNLIDYCSPENVFLAFKTDQEGAIWSGSLLGGLHEPRQINEKENSIKESDSEIEFSLEPVYERGNHYTRLKVHLTYHEQDKGILMNENLQKYFMQINKKEIKEHPELEGKPIFVFEQKVISKHESLSILSFPNVMEYLDMVNHIIQHLRPIVFLKVEKPVMGSFESVFHKNIQEKLHNKEMKSKKQG